MYTTDPSAVDHSSMSVKFAADYLVCTFLALHRLHRETVHCTGLDEIERLVHLIG